MIESIILALIVGAVIGLVARLVMPGKQDISVVVTVLIGALGGFIGSVVANQFGYHNANGGIAWIPFFIGVVAAVALIAVYESVMGRRTGLMGRRTGLMGRRGSLMGRRGGTGLTGRRGHTRLPW
ncbi:GlsB/YeaQ/YmgE family stress response membrane protein [Mycobacterium sp.]|uniref:GlsB/YeaQ/YmgE family stress response membrane protein n=1 Tax=Mycobacterium sp. TaxID=1785 RepID=UPI003BB10280